MLKNDQQQTISDACYNGNYQLLTNLTKNNRGITFNLLLLTISGYSLNRDSKSFEYLNIIKYLINANNINLSSDNIQKIENKEPLNHRAGIFIEQTLNLIKNKISNDNKLLQNNHGDIKASFIAKTQEDFIKCCESGDLKTLIFMINDPLLSRFVSVNYKNTSGQTGLLIAAQYGQLDIVKYLLTSPNLTEHADLRVVDKQGNTPIMLACCNRKIDIIKYLLENPEFKNQININQKDNIYGHNALLLASTNNSQELLNYFLLESSVKDELDLQATVTYGDNVLTFACSNKNSDIIKTLIVDKHMIIDDNTKKTLEQNAKNGQPIYSMALDMLKNRELSNQIKNKIKDFRPDNSNSAKAITKV